MAKIGMKKELQQLYHASAKEVVQVAVPALNFLMVDGKGDPNASREYVAQVRKKKISAGHRPAAP